MVSVGRVKELHQLGFLTFNQFVNAIDQADQADQAAELVPPRTSTARQSHASSSAGNEPTRPIEATHPMEEESVRRERPFAESDDFGDLGEEERAEMLLDPDGGVDDDGEPHDSEVADSLLDGSVAESVVDGSSMEVDCGKKHAICAARAPSATTTAPRATREPIDAPQLDSRQSTLDGDFILPLASAGNMPPFSRKAMTARKAPVNIKPASAVKKQGLGPARHNAGRGKSKLANGGRMNDIVNTELLHYWVKQWPRDGFKVVGGQLWCAYCKSQTGSGSDAVTKHVQARQHIKNKAQSKASDVSLNALKAALEEYRQTAINSGVQYQGMACVPEDTQLARAECLEQIIKTGIEPPKIDNLRPWLESRMQTSLVGKSHFMETYFPPLQLKERRLLTDSFKDAFIGCYHDGTSHEGELLSIVHRAVQPGFKFAIKLEARAHGPTWRRA